MNHIEILCSRVQSIINADDAELAALYVDMIGYNPFLEGVPSDEVRETLIDYVKEECYLAGIHVNEVGL